MTPTVLFEDKNFLAINKPAGMIVNRADTSKGLITLQDWIEKELKIENTNLTLTEKEKYMVDGYNKYDEFINRSGIVHRLDKETSGIILVAKNVDTFMALQNQFKSGEVKKVYQALVHGKVQPPTGEIDAPIGRLPWNRTRFGVLPEGRAAKTLYKALQETTIDGQDLTFVEVYPQAGRTHQIRVHFQYIQHPIFADELYAGRKQARQDRRRLSRHFLHASKIMLNDPETKQPIEFTSPLPEELASLIKHAS